MKKLIKNPVTCSLDWFYLSVLNLFVLIQFIYNIHVNIKHCDIFKKIKLKTKNKD